MKRSLTIDLARGFTVLCIAPIHTLLVYSRPYIAETLMAKILAFVAEWHGAQIFMFLMGLSMTFKSPQPLQKIFRRSGMLLLAAYGLNTLKLLVPFWLHGLSPQFLDALGIDPSNHPVSHLFLMGDILHFASIAYLITAIIYNHENYAKIALNTAIAICLISPLFYDMNSCNSLINYILNLFTGQPPQIFFPVFPWLIYPLLGLWFGSFLKKERPSIAFDSLWLVGAGILIVVVPLKWFLHDRGLSLFYRTTALDNCLHVSAVFIFLSIWNWVALTAKPNALFQLFTWSSRNITVIYLVQWILILWLMPLFGFRDLGWFMSVLAMLTTTLITLSLSLLLKLAIKKPAKP